MNRKKRDIFRINTMSIIDSRLFIASNRIFYGDWFIQDIKTCFFKEMTFVIWGKISGEGAYLSVQKKF
jgi:hypothetical protein